MAKGKKTQVEKLKAMKLTDGKSGPDAMVNMRSIDEILGTKTLNPYKANSVAEFEGIIKDMNLADMQSLATRVGLLPVADRIMLKKRLLDEFKKDLRKRLPYEGVSSVEINENLNPKLVDRAKRILGEGR